MSKIQIVKRICPGKMLPPFYGIAWHQYERNEAICLPVPFNLIAAILRSIWILLRFGFRNVEFSPRDAYYQGFRDGKTQRVTVRDIVKNLSARESEGPDAR